MPAKVTDANGLNQYAIKLFRALGWNCWRQHNGGVWDPTVQRFRKHPDSPNGIGDVMGFHATTGRLLCVETKTPNDRLSEDQRTFHSAVRDAGGLVIVMRHTSDLDEFLTPELRQKQQNAIKRLSKRRA